MPNTLQILLSGRSPLTLDGTDLLLHYYALSENGVAVKKRVWVLSNITQYSLRPNVTSVLLM